MAKRNNENEIQDKKEEVIDKLGKLADTYIKAVETPPQPFAMPQPIMVSKDTVREDMHSVYAIIDILNGMTVIHAKKILNAVDALMGTSGYVV